MQSFQAFTISLLLHIVLLLLMKIYSYDMQLEKKEMKKWLVFEQQEKHQPLMGEKTVRVKKETRTRVTSPAAMNSLKPEESTSKAFQELRHPTFGNNTSIKNFSPRYTPTEDDVFIHQAARPSESTRQRLQSFLPHELELGDVVALNTDQNEFYSFYRRMAEKIVWPWAQSVNAGFEKMRLSGQIGSSPKAWVTIVEVILDNKGNVLSTQPLQLAGDSDIDSAPISAFKNAKTFPNPPIEMVDEDGYIHIRYKFVVYYTPRPTGP
ncbi:MAG: energy transducer TonB [Bdellovibrionaceae bacterium]|nr:energy transducer TonB [Pseudobdellovibrionaceae bacterium]